MCEWSDKLVGWLDRELTAEEGAELERHLEDCARCRQQLDACRRTSVAIAAYGERALGVANRRIVQRRMWVASAAAVAAAAIVGAFLLSSRDARVEMNLPFSSSSGASPRVEEGEPVSPSDVAQLRELRGPTRRTTTKAVRTRRRRASVELVAPLSNRAGWSPLSPAIRIAIPVEAIFPPGAVPEGINFNADLTIAPDGSAQWLRLRP